MAGSRQAFLSEHLKSYDAGARAMAEAIADAFVAVGKPEEAELVRQAARQVLEEFPDGY